MMEAAGVEALWTTAFAITKSDSTVIDSRGLYVGGAGDVTILAKGDSTPVLFASVSAGSFLPIHVQKVMSTGTDATGIVGGS